MTLRLVIADSFWMTRAGLVASLGASDLLSVTGSAGDAAAAWDLVRQTSPDVLLLDSELPPTGGLALASRVKAGVQGPKVLLLSTGGQGPSVRAALQAGCDGVISKLVSMDELMQAIQAISMGGCYLGSEAARQLSEVEEAVPSSSPLDHLSPRELSVFHLVAQGRTNKDTGQAMSLSPRTVEKYRAAIMAKLGLRDAVELRLLAVRMGLVPQAQP